MQPLYLEPDRAVLLDELSAETRIAKAVLLREAVDRLLIHHGKLSKPSTRTLATKAIASSRRIVRKGVAEFRGVTWANYCSQTEEDLAALEDRLKEI
jgi:hypothetical protein